MWLTANGLSVAGGIGCWYVSSMCLTALNKILFDSLGFEHPFLVTTIHFTFMSLILRCGYLLTPCLCPDFPAISYKNYFKYIFPISFFTAIEIALSNLSYAMVSISVMTVIKSSQVVTTYLFGVLCGLEVFQWRLLGVIFLIVGSISITVPGMDIKDPIGVLCLCFALVFSSIRWVFVHHQLQKQRLLPLQLMLLTQPLATILLTPSVIWDLNSLIKIWQEDGIDVARIYSVCMLVSCAIILAFILLLSEYHLVRKTSSVSLTVIGIGKEILTICMSMLGFQEILTLRVAGGIALSIVGIIVYSRLRYANMREAEVGAFALTPTGSASGTPPADDANLTSGLSARKSPPRLESVTSRRQHDRRPRANEDALESGKFSPDIEDEHATIQL